ncbi:MAG: hypothetical protein NT069_07720 [Planctomycetota bacterium]|nr:hypothetical protein [Planctomycetota bacterium]
MKQIRKRRGESAVRKSAPKTRLQPRAVQPIRDGETYPLEIIEELLGISRSAICKAERKGLAIDPLGTKKYVSGEALRAYIHRNGSLPTA